MTFKLEVPALAGDSYGSVVADKLGRDHRGTLGYYRVYLAGHYGRARLYFGQGDLGEVRSRSGPEPAEVVGYLHYADRDGL